MKKKNIIILSIVILVLIIGYFGSKIYYINYINVLDLGEATWTSNLKKFTGPLIINKIEHDDADYLVYENMKIVNYFSEFEDIKITENNFGRTYSFTYDKSLSDDASDASKNAFFEISKFPTMIASIADNDYKLYKVNWANLLKKHDINNDIDFLELLATNYEKKLTVFSSFIEIKEVNALKQYLDTSIPKVENITLINGEYTGFIFNMPGIGKEVRIIIDDTTYSLSFRNPDYFNNDLIYEITSTLIIN